MERPTFTSLPEEMLFSIFEFCDIQSLGRLASTCRRFKNVINNGDWLWLKKSRFVLGSNMRASAMQKRCKPNLSMVERCQLTRSWKKGIGKTKIILRYYSCLPWLFLEQNHLFCSRGRTIALFARRDNGNVYPPKGNCFRPRIADVTKFVINGNQVVLAYTDGILRCWERNNFNLYHSFLAHESEIFSVDAKDDIIISGSRDKYVKIWKTKDLYATELQKEIPMRIRVLSTSIMPSNNYFVVGLPGTNSIHPLQLFDLKRGECITRFGGETFRNGAGILDIYPEDEKTFLCGGYDTTVQLWDIRCSQRCVSRWMDPYDNGIYCVRSDHNVTIVSGASRNSVIHIWDKRMARNQFIFVFEEYNSPVYSVAFDASHIYAAFDSGLLQHTYTCKKYV